MAGDSGIRWAAYQREGLREEHARELRDLLGAQRAGSTVADRLFFEVWRLDGRVVTATPESDGVRRIARAKGLPARAVLDQARAEGRRLLQL